MAQWVKNPSAVAQVSMEVQVWSLAWQSELKESSIAAAGAQSWSLVRELPYTYHVCGHKIKKKFFFFPKGHPWEEKSTKVTPEYRT